MGKSTPDHNHQSFKDLGTTPSKSARIVCGDPKGARVNTFDPANTALVHLTFFIDQGTLPADVLVNNFGELIWNNLGSILTEA